MKKLCLLLALLLVFSLFGCESGLMGDRDDHQDQDDDKITLLTAEEALEEALKALTGAESEGHPVILGADGTPAVPQNSGIAQLLSSHVTFDIQDCSTDGDSATAQVTISAPDAMALLKQAMTQADVTDAEALFLSMEALLTQDIPMAEYSVEIRLTKAGGSWCVIPDFALSNAITGGLTKAYQDLQQKLFDKLQEGGEGQ